MVTGSKAARDSLAGRRITLVSVGSVRTARHGVFRDTREHRFTDEQGRTLVWSRYASSPPLEVGRVYTLVRASVRMSRNDASGQVCYLKTVEVE